MIGFFNRVWEVVARIPKGKVATYGQIAAMLGRPRAARTVGWAMQSAPEHLRLPWHRVINANGQISQRGHQQEEELQRAMLEEEGVQFSDAGRVALARYRWHPERIPVDR